MKNFLVVASLLHILFLFCTCNSQRIAASLGTKTKKFQNSDQLGLSNTNGTRVVMWPSSWMHYLHTHNKIQIFPIQGDANSKDSDGVTVGTIRSLDLGFSGIYMEVTTSKRSKASKRVLLDGSIKGRAQPGRMLAIMGPSGAGSKFMFELFLKFLYRCIVDLPLLYSFGRFDGQSLLFSTPLLVE